MTGSRAHRLNLGGLWQLGTYKRVVRVGGYCLCRIGSGKRWGRKGPIVKQGIRILDEVFQYQALRGNQLEKITSGRCNVPSREHRLARPHFHERQRSGSEQRAPPRSLRSCLNERQHEKDDAKDLLEIPSEPDVIHGSLIARARNRFWYIGLCDIEI